MLMCWQRSSAKAVSPEAWALGAGGRGVGVSSTKFKLHDGATIHPWIAFVLSWEAGTWEDHALTIRKAWHRSVARTNSSYALEPSGKLTATQFQLLKGELRSSCGLLEEFLSEALESLQASGCTAVRRLDEVSLTEAFLDYIVDAKPRWEVGSIFFRHNWKLVRNYTELGIDAIAPIFALLDKSSPGLSDASDLLLCHESAVDRPQVSALDLVRAADVPGRCRNVRFMNFLLHNNISLMSRSDGCLDYVHGEAAFSDYHDAACHLDFDTCISVSGLSARAGFDPRTVTVSFLSNSLPRGLPTQNSRFFLNPHEVAIKAFCVAREPKPAVQGIPASTYRAILSALSRKGSIVSVGELRRAPNLKRLKIDAFAVEPGRIVVYAPSERHLSGDGVSFALREWVSDDRQARGKIHSERILTPLGPLALPDLSGGLPAQHWAPLQRQSGVIFRNEVVAALARGASLPQARRWVVERIGRELDRQMPRLGYVLLGSVYFAADAWDLRDAKRTPTAQLRERVSRALQAGRSPAVCETTSRQILELIHARNTNYTRA